MNTSRISSIKRSSKQEAFSLIELSIVILIIGLLISGILGGYQLIKAATLRAIMTEARGYAVMSSAFYAKYNTLPGDYPDTLGITPLATAVATTDKGNGNGIIEYVNASSNAEGLVAIKHLIQDGGLDASAFSTYTHAAAVPTYAAAATVPALVVGTILPRGKAKNSGWFFDNYLSTTAGADNKTINMAILSGGGAVSAAVTASTALPYASAWSATPVTPVLVPQDAKSIDTKMDDGKPGTGSIRMVASKNSAGSTVNTHTCSDAAIAATGPAITVNYSSASTVNCALGFSVDIER